MQLPEDLDAWTFDTVLQVVGEREYEPATFDYKALLNLPPSHPHRNEHTKNICRIACSLANSGGGFILFGVLDREKKVADLTDRIKGIPFGDHRKVFADKVQAVQQEIHFEAVPKPLILPTNPEKCVFVVHIPTSQARPHMVTLDGDGAFYRRGDGGKVDRMNFYEVREQMLNTEERRRKIKVLQLYVRQFRRTSGSLKSSQLHALATHERYFIGNFMTALTDILDLIPFESGVVQGLLDLPPAAENLNRLLDQDNHLTPAEKLPEGELWQLYKPRDWLHFAIDNFDRTCASVQQGLDALFGKLP